MKSDDKEERLLSEKHKSNPSMAVKWQRNIFTKTESQSSSKLYLVDLAKKSHKIISTPTSAYLPDWSHF
ncbi:Predicted protein [Wolbachia endosymbiont strain TRS of Brugia malayi]|nr:Predicted protein [Wolbachia endosymbiont strain TRS of Brugia malayi]